MPSPSQPHIAVIGAGLAGVAAARQLTRSGVAVTLLEKSSGWGGRCATKRWLGGRWDHGAQYVTLKNQDFREAVEQACGKDLHRITTPVRDTSGNILPGADRWCHAKGNSHLARDLGVGLTPRFETLITRIETTASGVLVDGEPFDAVISTAPLPQTLDLVQSPSVDTPFIPCLAVLIGLDQPPSGHLADTYAVTDPEAPILSWTACENHKPQRIPDGRTGLIAHTSEAFSRRYLDAPAEEWLPLVLGAVQERWKIDLPPGTPTLTHRWRFARVDTSIEPPGLPPRTYHASDALLRSRAESAWLSGIETSDHVLEELKV